MSTPMPKGLTRTVQVSAGSITTRAGHEHRQGDTVALPDVEARDLIRAGLARAVPAPEQAAKTASVAPPQDADTDKTTKGARR